MKADNEMLPVIQEECDVQAVSTTVKRQLAVVRSNESLDEPHQQELHLRRCASSPDTVSFMENTPISSMIENSSLVYIPIRLPCGVVAQCRPEVLSRCPQVLHDLNLDLDQCMTILPRSVHGLVKRTQIWINFSYCYGPKKSPNYLSHSTAHHHEGWLIW